jgi:tripartite-type tricarboxylate transporter receptor subunit TctC
MKVLAFALSALISTAAMAQSFPSRSVRWIVPVPPGGATDIIARIVAQKMTESWGQPVVVENRAGAAGVIGSDAVARSAPDGHTILMGTTSTHAVGPAINPRLPYNTLTDFTPVTLVATFPNVLVGHPSTASSLQELIALLKANPGKYAFGSSGAGSSTHLTGELFKLMTQTDVNHIPYKGTGPLLNDLMGGQVAFAFDQITAVMSPIQAGKMRALGVASAARNPALPDVPAIAEVLPGFESIAWVGILGPARMPQELTARIQLETKRILELPDIAQRMKELGATPVASAPADFAAFMAKDTEKWRSLVATAKIRIEQ